MTGRRFRHIGQQRGRKIKKFKLKFEWTCIIVIIWLFPHFRLLSHKKIEHHNKHAFSFFFIFVFHNKTGGGINEMLTKSADCKRGRKKGAARKVSKNFLTFFDDFWRFFALRENCRKVSKIFLTLFDDFWRFLTWPLSAGPFSNPLKKQWYYKKGMATTFFET